MFNRRIEDNPFRSLRLSVRTAASHVAKAGSTPAGITISSIFIAIRSFNSNPA
jgi:hypothetical protein